ncbi:MAG: DUF5985 family protein [Parcubacteria group bacterium]
MSPAIVAFVGGLSAAGYGVAGVFFLSFWRKTRDSLFMVFALAFGLMTLNQAIPVILGIPREEQSGVYLLRAAAFILIIVAILRKNLSRRDGA